MADIEGIARRIYGIIISPETVTGLINGGLSVPLDYGYLIYGIFDTGSRHQRETERIRMMSAIRHDILNYDNIANAAKLIFHLFDKYATEAEQDKAYRTVVTSIMGRISTNIIAANIAKTVIERTSFSHVVFRGKGNPLVLLSTILLMGGMAERSLRVSDSLSNDSPGVYALLRPRDYDLLYFLFVDAVQPFVDAIHARYTEGQPVFNRIMERVDQYMNKNAKAG